VSPAEAAGTGTRRLLAIAPWLAARGGATIEQIASRFGLTPTQAEDAVAIMGFIGVPPYGPGDMLQVDIDTDGLVTVFGPLTFASRPPRLNAREAFAIVAASRAAAVLGGDDNPALASALAKLESTLGSTGRLAVDLDRPELLDDVRAAVRQGLRLRIRYYAAWRDTVTEREIDPVLVHSAAGRWYVDAFDHASGEYRPFRLDRIEAAEPTGERFDRPEQQPDALPFTAAPGAERVVLDLPTSARWVTESYPCEYEELDGRLRVTLTVVGSHWLARLLLRVGPEARVLEPAELADVGRDTARRVLAIYGD
jgi:proteasome accessory factor C